jgi:hypothetical protein
MFGTNLVTNRTSRVAPLQSRLARCPALLLRCLRLPRTSLSINITTSRSPIRTIHMHFLRLRLSDFLPFICLHTLFKLIETYGLLFNAICITCTHVF